MADFPRVACSTTQEAVKDVSFSFLGEFSDYFLGENGGKVNLAKYGTFSKVSALGVFE